MWSGSVDRDGDSGRSHPLVETVMPGLKCGSVPCLRYDLSYYHAFQLMVWSRSRLTPLNLVQTDSQAQPKVSRRESSF